MSKIDVEVEKLDQEISNMNGLYTRMEKEFSFPRSEDTSMTMEKAQVIYAILQASQVAFLHLIKATEDALYGIKAAYVLADDNISGITKSIG